MKRYFLIGLVIGLTCFSSYAQSLEKDVIRAFGLYESGKYGDAIGAFDDVINRYNSFDQKCIYYRGISRYHLKNYNSAKFDFQEALKSGVAEAGLWLARIHSIYSQNTEAVFYIDKYLKEVKQPGIAEIKKDSVFKKLHNTEEWFSLWQRYEPTEENNIHDEIVFHLKRKDFKAAHTGIENNLNREFDNSVLYELNSQVYFAEGNYQLALNEINRALSLKPEEIQFQKLKADYLVKLNKDAEAVEIYTRILEAEPGDFSSRFARAEAALLAGDFELAESDARIYMEYFSNPDAGFLIGQIFYEQAKYLDALKQFNNLLEEDTSVAKYFKARGMTYYQTGTYKFAAYDLSMSLDLDPNNAQANLYLGLSKHQLGDNELCCYYLKRAKNFGELSAIKYLQKYCDK